MAKSAANVVTNRLTDIQVKEVSLVDRAANKRQFLVTKRDGSGMSKKLVADGRGGYSEIEKSDDAPPAAATPPTPAAPAAAELASAGASAAVAATDTEKAEAVAKMGAVAERLLIVTKAFRDSGEAPPENFVEELVSMLEQIPVLKRRMGKGRMDKFEKGLSELTDLLTELKGEVDTTKGAVVPAVPATSAPAAPVTKSAREVELEVEIRKLREAPARGNSAPTEEASAGGAEYAWPSDMSSGKRDEEKKKAGLTF